MAPCRHALIAAVLVFGSLATAAPLSVTFEGVGPGSGSAGMYNWNTGGTTYNGVVYTPLAGDPTHFITFCIQQNQYISPGATYTHNYQFSPLTAAPVGGGAVPMSASTAESLEKMWGQFFGTLDTADEAAAFQNAVWHLVAGYNPSLSAAVDGYYDDYLNPTNWKSGKANLIAITSGENQDQILQLKPGYQVIDGDIVPTPEPTTLALGLLAAPAVVLGLRRKRAA